MAVKELTVEQTEIKEGYEALITKIREYITLNKPTDTDTEKIIGRGAAMAGIFNRTRTSVMGASVYIAMTAPVVGLTKDQIINIITMAYDEAEKSPAFRKMKEEYEKLNAAHHAELGGAFKVPDSGLVH